MSTTAIDAYVEYLRTFPRFGAKDYLQLERIRLLLKYLGNPQRQLKGFQIAGTNGKGSTTAMIASVLQTAGFKTGAFYSPHLVSYAERMQINGRPIAERDLIRLLKRVKPVVIRVERELKDRPTWFEVLTAIAATWFAEQAVDWVAFEVGLGGRLDSTTALGLKYKVITDIGKDHTHILGKTIPAIAGEKAGIIQASDVVVTSNVGSAREVIRKRCQQVQAHLLPSSPIHLKNISLHGTSFTVGQHMINLSLVGLKQPVNAGLAFDITRAALGLSPRVIFKGLECTTLPARFQILRRQPLTILDGAHNPAAMRELMKTMRQLRVTSDKVQVKEKGRRNVAETLRFPSAKHTVVIVYAAKETKDYPQMLALLRGVSSDIYFPRLTIPNMVAPEILKKSYRHGGVMPDLKTALKRATLKAGASGTVLITGSLYLAGEVLKYPKEAI